MFYDTKMAEPRRLEGDKPIKRASIDWEHPFSKGLVSLKLFNKGNGIVDLVDNSSGTIYGTGIKNNRFYLDLGTSYVLFNKNIGDYISNKWTIWFDIESVQDSVDSRFVFGGYTAGSYDWGLYYANNLDLRFVYNADIASSLIIANSDFSIGTGRRYVITSDGTTVTSYGSDGSIVTSAANAIITSTYEFGVGHVWYSGTQELLVNFIAVKNYPVNKAQALAMLHKGLANIIS